MPKINSFQSELFFHLFFIKFTAGMSEWTCRREMDFGINPFPSISRKERKKGCGINSIIFYLFNQTINTASIFLSWLWSEARLMPKSCRGNKSLIHSVCLIRPLSEKKELGCGRNSVSFLPPFKRKREEWMKATDEINN